ncbi:MAG: D-tyrosyl-tRNA(Tyr) deacylase [Clostridiales bacterium]|nr:D-tyrosyl-tRNA(Tyr) deacylase [Clostridiales bacterium]
MRAVIQRVSQAKVKVGQDIAGQIDKGFLVYLGVEKEDQEEDLVYILDKTINLRVFEDQDGKMNLSIGQVGGSILAVSQFTLYGDCRRGRRPSFSKAAGLDKAEEFYNKFVDEVRKRGINVETGVFRAHMDVESINDGPVTILLDSKKTF